MITAARLFYTRAWKSMETLTVENWWLKNLELAEMAKLISLIRENAISIFMTNWKPFIDFLHENEKVKF